jgi:Zn-dependent M28 family amino/carboxypeptidase
VLAANDGASGVGVMLEVARLLQNDTTLAIGVDLVCFDAEDYGTPQWAEKNEDSEKTWALGAQYWAKNLPEGYNPQFGILLDMVGGQGAKIYQEQLSLRYAASIVDKVWSAARHAGYSSVFVNEVGGQITDDHVPVNKAGIPTVDVIPFYPDCRQSAFGPTWHTVNDDMEHLDINTLKAVGQMLIQVIYSE